MPNGDIRLFRADKLEDLPAVLSVIAASQILGIGKNRAYSLISRGAYPVRVLNIDGRYKVSRYDLLTYLGAPGYGRSELTRDTAS
jgi:hypothetical protein